MAGAVSNCIVASACILLVFASLHDAAVRTIPNWLSALLGCLGLALSLLRATCLINLLISLILLVILGLVWLRGYLGGGDVKLIPAVAMLLPPGQVPSFIMLFAIAGGLLALFYVAASSVVRRPGPGRRLGLGARILKAEAWRMHRRSSMPYAIAVAAGALPPLIASFPG